MGSEPGTPNETGGRRRGRRAPLSAHRVEAPGAGAGEDEIEEDQAVEDRRVAAVQRGVDALRGVRDPVGGGHQARQDEGDRTGEEAEDQQRAAHEFEHARDPRQRERGRVEVGGGKAQDLLGPVGEEDQRGDDAKHAQHLRAPGVEGRGMHGVAPSGCRTAPVLLQARRVSLRKRDSERARPIKSPCANNECALVRMRPPRDSRDPHARQARPPHTSLDARCRAAPDRASYGRQREEPRTPARGSAGWGAVAQPAQRASASSIAAVKPISEKVSWVCVPREDWPVSTASAPERIDATIAASCSSLAGHAHSPSVKSW